MDYATRVRLHRFSLREQLATFRTCLSTDMRATMLHAVAGTTEARPVDELLDMILAYLRSQRSVAVDRVAFAERVQRQGESFDDFLVALREIAANADLCESCLDQQLVTRLMCGVLESDTRRKLLAISPFPSLHEVVTICRTRESAARSDSLLTRDLTSDGALVQQASIATQATATDRPVARHSTCPDCGYTAHMGRRPCPAHGATCNKCGKTGHFGQVCRKFTAAGASSAPGRVHANPVHVLGVSSQCQRAPMVSVQLHNAFCAQVYGTCRTTPDTCSEANIMGYSVMSSLGIDHAQMGTPPPADLVTANGSALNCVGTLIFDVHFGNRSAVTEFLICDDFKSVLIAWFTCRDLRIIPAEYPAPAQPVLPDPLLTSVRCAKTTASSAESLGLDSLPEQPTPQECRTIRDHRGALSRAPHSDPSAEDELLAAMVHRHVSAVVVNAAQHVVNESGDATASPPADLVLDHLRLRLWTPHMMRCPSSSGMDSLHQPTSSHSLSVTSGNCVTSCRVTTVWSCTERGS